MQQPSLRIALLEDDRHQVEVLANYLRQSDCHVDAFYTGAEFLYAVAHESYDILIVDWHLPDTEGPDVVKQVRARHAFAVPVLFLTQRDGEEDVVAGLSAGADDYMVKPPRLAELKARITALTRRSLNNTDQQQAIVNYGPFTINLESRSIQLHNERVSITDKDFELTLFLFQNIGRLLSREYLLERIWGISCDINTRTVDTHMSRLRRKLGIKPENGYRIKTVYQHGYRLEEVKEGA